MCRVTARTDRLLLANAIMGQFLTGVATRIFIVSLPTLAMALNTDIIAISWALLVYQLAGISRSAVLGALGRIHGRHTIYGARLLMALTVMLTVLLDRRSVEAVGAERATVMTLLFAATLVGFLAHERRAVSPVVNLALFKIRMFTFSILSLLLIATTISVMSFLMPFYIKDVLGFSASFMGLIFLAAPVFTIGLAAVSGRLTDRIGPRIPESIGVLAT